MSPELITAVKERLELNYSHAEIEAELVATGYEPAVAKQAILHAEQALHEPSAPIPAPGVTPEAATMLTAKPAVLPGVSDLFLAGWEQLRQRYDLALLLAAPYLVLAVVEHLLFIGPGEESAAGLLATAVASFGALAVYALMFAIAVRSVVMGMNVPFRFGDAVAWATAHYFAVVGLMFTVFFVVTGGLMLLIIPGLIIMGYVYLAQYVLAAEGTGGLAAVLRSRALIYGQWWEVVLRLLGVATLFFITVFLIAMLVAIVAIIATGYDPEVVNPLATLIEELLGSLVSGAITLYFLGVGRAVYESLRDRSSSTSAPPAERQYRVIFWIGVVVSVAAFILLLATAGTAINSPDQLGDTPLPILDEAAFDETEESDTTGATDAKERANALREQGGLEELDD